jgi:hypothetical protein
MAGRATFPAPDLYLGFGAKYRVFKLDCQVEPQVVASVRPRSAALPPARREHLAE